MRSNWQYALLAILLAFLSWYYVSGREQVETWVEIPVEFTSMPEDLIVLNGLKSRISVRLRGSKGMIRNLDQKGMIYSLSLKGLQPGVNVIPFKTDAVPVIKAFEVMELNPSRLTLEVDKIVSKPVPVKPGWAGDVNKDMKFVGIKAEPDEVTVKGPAGVVEKIDMVGTQPLMTNQMDTLLVQGEVPVVLPENVESKPERVQVTLEFAYQTEKHTLEVTLMVTAPDTTSVELVDKMANLTLAVPLPVSREENWQDSVKAQVTIPEGTSFGDLEISYDILAPEGIQVVKKTPEKARIRVSPAQPETPPAPPKAGGEKVQRAP